MKARDFSDDRFSFADLILLRQEMRKAHEMLSSEHGDPKRADRLLSELATLGFEIVRRTLGLAKRKPGKPKDGAKDGRVKTKHISNDLARDHNVLRDFLAIPSTTAREIVLFVWDDPCTGRTLQKYVRDYKDPDPPDGHWPRLIELYREVEQVSEYAKHFRRLFE
jgi:hypothetical protein